jgi:hypothetical protein
MAKHLPCRASRAISHALAAPRRLSIMPPRATITAPVWHRPCANLQTLPSDSTTRMRAAPIG